MKTTASKGHLLAVFTILVWGTTFISTKVLLQDFAPIDILFYRFSIGFIALLCFYPKPLKLTDRKQELYFALAGLCGVTLYFLLENIALTYTLASNVGVIISVAPFFTAIFAKIFLPGEKLRPQFFIGFLVAMAGIFLISFNGSAVLKLNPIGDVLALFSAVVWSCYAILTKKISSFQYPVVQSTRRIFFYGLLFMIPALFLFNFQIDITRFLSSKNTLNILYLGLGASALCFMSWNQAVTLLGAVKTSVYIYMVPVITVVTSVLILHEQVTTMSLWGTGLTLIGLFLSESKLHFFSWAKKSKTIRNKG